MKKMKMLLGSLLSAALFTTVPAAYSQDRTTDLDQGLMKSLDQKLIQRLNDDKHANMTRNLMAYGQPCKLTEGDLYGPLIFPLLIAIPKMHSDETVLFNKDKIQSDLEEAVSLQLFKKASLWMHQLTRDMTLTQTKYMREHGPTIGQGNTALKDVEAKYSAWQAEYIQKTTGIAFPSPFCDQLKSSVSTLESWLKDQAK